MLDAILARTAEDLASRKETAPIAELEAVAKLNPPPLGLQRTLSALGMSVIAEIKRASPSRGTFPVNVEPGNVANDYIAGGAAAISVLTDAPFFQGSLKDLGDAARIAHAAVRPVPVLQKDFVSDPYQIVEARAYGADAILLIVAALGDAALAEVLAAAREWKVDALVELHDEREMERAFRAGVMLVGINNRDLKTFTVDLGVTERLAPLAPQNTIVVAESGVFGSADVRRLHRAGARAVLVGEGLISATDRSAAVKALLA
ncbi:MAG: indole-3-glycerol phosphate synthase TrpC [Chloroflexi bacterium]|nr:indole-3-glycerol phosphate synthase TrpC [Chloroflexota bacterium]